MNIAGLDDVVLTRDQHRLLGGWRDILDDLSRLCRSLKALPDTCTCGQGASHLSGSCPCCHTAHDGRVPACDDCDQLLAKLRPALDSLLVDTMRFFPIVKDLLNRHAPDTVREEGLSVERDIAAIYRTFGRLVIAADEFRAGCRASHLKTLKAHSASLLSLANQLDRRLEGPQR